MGGFSVECDCGKWFLDRHAYKDHCKGKGCTYHPERVGPKPRSTESKMTEPVGTLLTKTVGDLRLSIIPLTLDRARLVVGPARDVDSYDDGW